jgi:hypothetical protein
MVKKRKVILDEALDQEKIKEWEDIVSYMEEYFYELEKYRPQGEEWISYYKSARGYFKYSNRLPEEKFDHFGKLDYKLWEWILKTVKSTSYAALSGGLFFRHSQVEHFCSKASFYRSRKKFSKLKLLLDTPFKDYYILNPDYILKLYNPKNKNAE